jgi:hypothetical protein
MLTLLVFIARWPRDRRLRARAGALTSRVNETSIWVIVRQEHSWQPLWEATWRTLGMFHYQQGPEYHWFGLGFDPAFNLVVGALVAHGLVASVLGWRQARSVLLLVWVAVGLAPGILSGGAPRLYRSLLATPPLYVWAALPLAQMLAVARVRALPALRAAAVALVVAIPFIDSQYYFYRVYTHPVFHWFQGERIVEMARTLRRYGPGWNGYLMADNFDAGHETVPLLSRAWNLDVEPVSSPRRRPAAHTAARARRVVHDERGDGAGRRRDSRHLPGRRSAVRTPRTAPAFLVPRSLVAAERMARVAPPGLGLRPRRPGGGGTAAPQSADRPDGRIRLRHEHGDAP